MERYLYLVLIATILGSLVLVTHRSRTRSDVTGTVVTQPILTGEWVQQSRIVNGKLMQDPTGVYLVVTADGRMEHHVPNEGLFQPRSTIVGNQYFRMQPSGEFLAIDKSGRPDWSDLTMGLSYLDGDNLTLCFAPKGQPRPKVLATGDVEGAGSVLMVFKRR